PPSVRNEIRKADGLAATNPSVGPNVRRELRRLRLETLGAEGTAAPTRLRQPFEVDGSWRLQASFGEQPAAVPGEGIPSDLKGKPRALEPAARIKNLSFQSFARKLHRRKQT